MDVIFQISFRYWHKLQFYGSKWRKIFKNPFLKALFFLLLALVAELALLKQPTSLFVGQPHHVKLPESLFFQTLLEKPVSFQTASDSPVGRPLTEAERATIQQLLPNAQAPDKFPAFEQLPLFILHDTAGLLAKSTVYEKQKRNNGPLGDGIAAYIARDGEPIVTRNNFWDVRRPTALAYEKSLDIVAEKARNQAVRQVYRLTSDSGRTQAFEAVTKGLTVNQNNLIKGANIWLNTTSESQFNSISRNYRGGLDGAKSTGIWAMTQVCHDVLDGVNLARSANQKGNLTKICQKVYPALKASRQRIAAAVNVEVVQHMGSHCFLTDSAVRTYNAYNPPYARITQNRVVSLQKDGYGAYPDSQYEGLAIVYLYSALQAGIFPEITTHFLLDKGIGDHCDPRGLDLKLLYEKISQRLGHPWGTRYGINPQYGTNLDAGDNVWWAEKVLGIKPF
ncbi:MAG: hypothetical protein AB4041_05405 [Microcystaceae cyanobacterium]